MPLLIMRYPCLSIFAGNIICLPPFCFSYVWLTNILVLFPSNHYSKYNIFGKIIQQSFWLLLITVIVHNYPKNYSTKKSHFCIFTVMPDNARFQHQSSLPCEVSPWHLSWYTCHPSSYSRISTGLPRNIPRNDSSQQVFRPPP